MSEAQVGVTGLMGYHADSTASPKQGSHRLLRICSQPRQTPIVLSQFSHDFCIGEDLSLIFQKVVPDDGASLPQRYAAALRSFKPGRSKKVESLMEEILEKLSLLQANHYFQTAARSQDLDAALEQLSEVTSSLPDEAALVFSHSGRGAINANTGSGNQYNNNLSGDNNTQKNNYSKQ